MVWTYPSLLVGMLSFQKVTTPLAGDPMGKFGSLDTSRRYVTASGTAVQSK
jgi:hypothetical protein